jgi:hypothetical protein
MREAVAMHLHGLGRGWPARTGAYDDCQLHLGRCIAVPQSCDRQWCDQPILHTILDIPSIA